MSRCLLLALLASLYSFLDHAFDRLHFAIVARLCTGHAGVPLGVRLALAAVESLRITSREILGLAAVGFSHLQLPPEG